MKKFVLLSFLGIALSSFALFKVNVFDFHHLFGRCSASNDYCNACSNCSACKNCAENGGSCAVCYTPRTNVRKSRPVKTYRPKDSFSSNETQTSPSIRPAVKRYYLRKSSGTKYPAARVSGNAGDSEAKSFTSKEESKSNLKSSTAIANETQSIDNPESIYLTSDIPAEKESFTVDISENAVFVRVSASSANLRESSSTKSPVLQRLKHGDLLIKLKSVKGWVKVQALDSGEVGYVFANLLK